MLEIQETQEPKKTKMFQSVFSFNGRIRRMEFVITFVIFLAVDVLVTALTLDNTYVGGRNIFMCSFIVILALQLSKRFHDMGKSSWYILLCIIVPLVLLWPLFADGEPFTNQYGPDPKGRELSKEGE